MAGDLTTELLARCTFPPAGTPVACAVSGGADSLALLALAVARECIVTAVHVDHGLRPGSDAEGELVAAAAARFGASFRSARVEVAPGPNLEARAREARHAVLPRDTLLGHTADDQAETILLNLMRGAGLEGLGGMRPERRPILALRRSETHRLCAELGLEVVDDPTNRDLAFRRNRVRHELIPLLDDIAERDVVPVLVRQAEIVRAAADELDERSSDMDPMDVSVLQAASPAIARHVVRSWLRGCSDQRHPPDAAAVDRVLAVIGGTTKATEVGGGWRVERHQQRLVLVPPPETLG